MPDCTTCGAPLPTESLVCSFCQSRNDIDLRPIHEIEVSQAWTGRICPCCEIGLTAVNVAALDSFVIEQCPQCHGLFFDPDELPALLDHTVAADYRIDYQRLTQLNAEAMVESPGTRYRKCPVCKELMNRINAGTRSGVVTDQCRAHGIWLDGGEFRRLLEWRRVGGDQYCTRDDDALSAKRPMDEVAWEPYREAPKTFREEIADDALSTLRFLSELIGYAPRM